MKTHTFSFVLSMTIIAASAHASTIQDNLNRITTPPAPVATYADCQKWTASPIQFNGDTVSVDAGKLALELAANAVASYTGGKTTGTDPRVCHPRTPAGRL